MAALVCQNGHPNDNNSRFCTTCGSPLSFGGSPSAPLAENTPVAPFGNPTVPPLSNPPIPPIDTPYLPTNLQGNGSNKPLIVVIASGCVALLILLGGGFFWYQNSQPDIATSGNASTGSPADNGPSDAATLVAGKPPAPLPAGSICQIGSLLPDSGNLAFLGPAMFAGVDLAVRQINQAGGIGGADLVHLRGDSGDTSTGKALATVNRHLANGVMAIVGAASSGVSLTVIDTITGAGVVQMSPANTSPTLSDYSDDGFYFRTAPPDTFQGVALGDLIYRDGHKTVSILALDDPYGTGLADALERAFVDAGGQVNQKVIYDPQSISFKGEVTTAKRGSPKAIVVIGFEESTDVVREMIAQGVGPRHVAVYLVDGNLSSYAFRDLPRGVMRGVKGTLPGVSSPDQFKKRLLKVDPSLQDFSYAPESWDAVNLLALAATIGSSCDGKTIRANLPNVSGSNGGEKCTDFDSCNKLLQQGIAIDYEGLSGPINFNKHGDPSKAIMGIYEYTSNDSYQAVDFVPGQVPLP